MSDPLNVSLTSRMWDETFIIKRESSISVLNSGISVDWRNHSPLPQINTKYSFTVICASAPLSSELASPNVNVNSVEKVDSIVSSLQIWNFPLAAVAVPWHSFAKTELIIFTIYSAILPTCRRILLFEIIKLCFWTIDRSIKFSSRPSIHDVIKLQ